MSRLPHRVRRQSNSLSRFFWQNLKQTRFHSQIINISSEVSVLIRVAMVEIRQLKKSCSNLAKQVCCTQPYRSARNYLIYCPNDRETLRRRLELFPSWRLQLGLGTQTGLLSHLGQFSTSNSTGEVTFSYSELLF